MGVHGLWRLIEPSGKPVPLETLENKVLAVDVSIWLHQAIKGFQDAKGGSIPNAHLLGIYHRVCKLLYFKIKPVFVFDGGVPVLKKQTIEKRNQFKQRSQNDANKLQEQLLSTILKHSAISKVLSDKAKAAIESQTKTKISPVKNQNNDRDNMFILPEVPVFDNTISDDSDSEYITEDSTATEETDSSPTKQFDLHTIETKSKYFKALPADVRHEILTDLKATRKQSSWGRLHELPSQSNDFSVFQMRRLLKRQEVQSALEEAEQEMGGYSLSLGELETILNDHGVITTEKMGKRIASDENTRFLLIKDIKQAMEKAKTDEQLKKTEDETKIDDPSDQPKETKLKTIAEEEFDEDLKLAIELSLQEEPSTSKNSESSKIEEVKRNLSFIDENFDYSDSSDDLEEVPTKKTLTSAQSYMMEYSGLTPSEISKIIGNNAVKNHKKPKKHKLNTVPEEVKIVEESKTIDVSSDSDSDLLEVPENSESEKTLQTNEKTKKVAPLEKVQNVDESKTTDTLSDSDSDFLEVPDSQEEMEIVVDPNKSLEDDLFSDIFVDNKAENVKDIKDEVKVIKTPLEVVVNLDEAPDKDDLFDDVFIEEDKNKKVSFQEEPTVHIIKNLESNPEINLNTKEVDTIENPKEENKDTQMDTNSETIKTPEKIIPTKLQEPKSSEIETISNLSEKELQEMKTKLKNQQIDLLVEKCTKERMAKNISDQMYQEAQELLELFGVPYIIAPMEAEAQCAFLDDINLTDGTITDDSDIWLFGGKTVYKNFFNQAKQVMEFKAENIKHHFKLSREQMILLALLVGSDYTTGLQGVGPVTAMEILAAFPPMLKNEINLTQSQLVSGLREFHVWFEKGKGKPRLSLKKKLKNVHFTENFPSLQVVQAYMEPTVEKSKEKFSWGKPDIVSLTDFAREKFGWTKLKTEEILKPVIKKIAESSSQKTIKDYFRTKFLVQPSLPEEKISKRVKMALERFDKNSDEDSDEEEKPKRGRKKVNDGEENKVKKVRGKINLSKTEDEPKEPADSKPKNVKVRKNSKDVKNGNKEENSTENPSETVKKDTEDKPKEKAKTVTARRNSKAVKNDNIIESTSKKETNSKPKQTRRRKAKSQDETNPSPTKKSKTSDPTLSVIPEELQLDSEVQNLQKIASTSAQKVDEISNNLTMELNKKLLLQKAKEKELRQELIAKQIRHLHIKKEVVYQKEMDKSQMLRSKMKAIEVFRRGKMGPGYVPKSDKKKRLPKDEAGLSESSSDD